MGLRTEQFIFVREPHPLRRMAAFEEALGTSGLGAVINEYGSLSEKTDLWQRSARRLQLACERGTAAGFMVGAAGRANGFETAWHIAPSLITMPVRLIGVLSGMCILTMQEEGIQHRPALCGIGIRPV